MLNSGDSIFADPNPSVDEFIERAQPFAKPILTHVRERVHTLVPDVREDIRWRMPAFMRGNSILLIVGAFKAHVAINFWRGDSVVPHETSGALGQLGRLTTLDDLPAEFDALILAAADTANAPPTRRKREASSPPAQIHPHLSAALDGAPAARACFDAFTPAQQRDYVEWIADAKQEQTRARRIAQAIEWIGEGKRRNWQYERR